MLKHILMITVGAPLLLAACTSEVVQQEAPQASVETVDAPDTPAPNFIVLIGDDMSVETLSCFGVGEVFAETPNLDKLCALGMRFDNFWTQPVCSPTRAAILSGQYGFRNGVGTPAVSRIPPQPSPDATAFATQEFNEGAPRPEPGMRAPAPGLRRDAFTLPMALKAGPETDYETVALGKWHLADPDNGGIDHPNLAGFGYYRGPIRGGGPGSYFSWSEVENGVITEGDSGWADSAKVDDALTFLNNRNGEQPFLLWMAFSAPHGPFHKPPVALLNSDEAKALDPNGLTQETHRAYYRAMIEALDTEIGRLLDGVDPDVMANTYVLFLGDNGTPEEVANPPFDFYHAKGSITQGGVNVPFIFAGPDIEAGSTAALANSVDIYATLVDLAGIDAANVMPSDKVFDTISLEPVLKGTAERVRDFAYVDVFGLVPKGIVSEKAIRNETHKLHVMTDGGEHLFDLIADPYEATDLLEAALSEPDQAAYDDLKAKLNALVSP